MPRWVNCKHCKAQGWLYPSHDERCRTCDNDATKKQVCDRCRGKGWEKIVESVMCCDCNGDGRIWVEEPRRR
jgi:DnaJ-class molecular chaperone